MIYTVDSIHFYHMSLCLRCNLDAVSSEVNEVHHQLRQKAGDQLLASQNMSHHVPLKRDHFNRKYIFPTIDFKGSMSVFGGVTGLLTPTRDIDDDDFIFARLIIWDKDPKLRQASWKSKVSAGRVSPNSLFPHPELPGPCN